MWPHLRGHVPITTYPYKSLFQIVYNLYKKEKKFCGHSSLLISQILSCYEGTYVPGYPSICLFKLKFWTLVLSPPLWKKKRVEEKEKIEKKMLDNPRTTGINIHMCYLDFSKVQRTGILVSMQKGVFLEENIPNLSQGTKSKFINCSNDHPSGWPYPVLPVSSN